MNGIPIKRLLRSITIKWKLVGVTTLALTLILALFSIVVYSVSINTLFNSQQQILSSKSKAIVDDYVSHLHEGPDASNQQESEQLSRINSYLAEGQIIEIRLSNGNTISQSSQEISAKEFDAQLLKNPNNYNFNGTHSTTISDSHIFTLSITRLRILIISTPIYDGDQLIGSVVVGQSLDQVDEYLTTLAWLLIAGSLVAIALAGFSGYLFARTALRPVRDIIHTVQQINAKRLNTRVHVLPQKDEISLLASTCNEMLERIEQSFVLQNQFLADASHELRTPLSTIEGYANMLDRWGKHDEAVRDNAIQVIKKESQRLKHLANDLLQLFSIESEHNPLDAQCDVTKVIQETIQQYRDILANSTQETTSILMELDETRLVGMILEDHLKQILLILLDNALKHTTDQDQIKITVTTCGEESPIDSNSNDKMIQISVSDTGEGILPEDLPNVFNRFYRADKARTRQKGGSGLGLSIAKAIVESYGGKIQLKSSWGSGTDVQVMLRMKENG